MENTTMFADQSSTEKPVSEIFENTHSKRYDRKRCSGKNVAG